MDGDGSGGRDGGFESLFAALRRANREVSAAVGHGVESVRRWMDERWLPLRLVVLGGCSWATSKAFGWLLRRFIEISSRVASLLAGIRPNVQILLFFTVYVLHSVTQTKLILGIETKLGRMDSGSGAEVRADGGGDEEFSSCLWGLGGIAIGAIIGSSFGIEGAFVGAGLGWGLGDELDRRLEAKVNETGRVPRTEQKHAEKP